jgi:hypothetical protein
MVKPSEAIAQRRRRLFAAAVAILAAVLAFFVAEPASNASVSSLEAEATGLPSGSLIFSDDAASGGRAIMLYENGRATARFDGSVDRMAIRARGDRCEGAPHMVVEVDGVQVSQVVNSTYWADYSADITLPAGDHTVTISYTNDHATASCDRNLRVDRINLLANDPQPLPPPPPPPAVSNIYTASHEAESFTVLEVGQAHVNTNASGG